jgi:DNA polymerase III epsilon subunit-like protein
MTSVNQLRRGPYNLDSSVELVNFLFLDTETSGLKPNRSCRITEIAILDRSDALFSWYTNSHEQLINFEHIPKLFMILKDGVVVAHNLKFDLSFIAYEASVHGLSLPPLLCTDTLTIAKSCQISPKCYKLESLLKYFDIRYAAPLHTAINDAQAVRALFWKLIEIGDISTLKDAKVQKLFWSTY